MKLKFEGEIDTVDELHRLKKDVDVEKGKLVIKNGDGDKVVIQGDKEIIDGFLPGEEVEVSVSSLNQKLVEDL